MRSAELSGRRFVPPATSAQMGMERNRDVNDPTLARRIRSRETRGVVHATVPGDAMTVLLSAQNAQRKSLVEWWWTTMTTAVKAIYENGVFKPKEPVQLQERTEVEVLIPTQSPSDDDPSGWAAARALIGFIDDAPADMAEQHDHYLYGRPRE